MRKLPRGYNKRLVREDYAQVLKELLPGPKSFKDIRFSSMEYSCRVIQIVLDDLVTKKIVIENPDSYEIERSYKPLIQKLYGETK